MIYLSYEFELKQHQFHVVLMAEMSHVLHFSFPNDAHDFTLQISSLRHIQSERTFFFILCEYLEKTEPRKYVETGMIKIFKMYLCKEVNAVKMSAG